MKKVMSITFILLFALIFIGCSEVSSPASNNNVKEAMSLDISSMKKFNKKYKRYKAKHGDTCCEDIPNWDLKAAFISKHVLEEMEYDFDKTILYAEIKGFESTEAYYQGGIPLTEFLTNVSMSGNYKEIDTALKLNIITDKTYETLNKLADLNYKIKELEDGPYGSTENNSTKKNYALAKQLVTCSESVGTNIFTEEQLEICLKDLKFYKDSYHLGELPFCDYYSGIYYMENGKKLLEPDTFTIKDIVKLKKLIEAYESLVAFKTQILTEINMK